MARHGLTIGITIRRRLARILPNKGGHPVSRNRKFGEIASRPPSQDWRGSMITPKGLAPQTRDMLDEGRVSDDPTAKPEYQAPVEIKIENS
jgi:hypothetical protein